MQLPYVTKELAYVTMEWKLFHTINVRKHIVVFPAVSIFFCQEKLSYLTFRKTFFLHTIKYKKIELYGIER